MINKQYGEDLRIASSELPISEMTNLGSASFIDMANQIYLKSVNSIF